MYGIPDNEPYTKTQILNAYHTVFNTQDGRIALEDMKQACHFYTSLVGGQVPMDPLRLAFAEGERNSILRILAILESKEEDYVRSAG